MSENSVTFRRLFGDVMPTAKQLEALESTTAIKSLRDSISIRAPRGAWPAVVAAVMNATDDLLSVNVAEVLVAAWTAQGIVRQYADPNNHPPNETLVVPLVTHTIESVHKPYVELLIGDQSLGRVDFEIDLEVTLEGALLTIRDGKIVEVRVGSCEGKGRIDCEGVTIAQTNLKPILLPDVISVKDDAPQEPGAPLQHAD